MCLGICLFCTQTAVLQTGLYCLCLLAGDWPCTQAGATFPPLCTASSISKDGFAIPLRTTMPGVTILPSAPLDIAFLYLLPLEAGHCEERIPLLRGGIERWRDTARAELSLAFSHLPLLPFPRCFSTCYNSSLVSPRSRCSFYASRLLLQHLLCCIPANNFPPRTTMPFPAGPPRVAGSVRGRGATRRACGS